VNSVENDRLITLVTLLTAMNYDNYNTCLMI